MTVANTNTAGASADPSPKTGNMMSITSPPRPQDKNPSLDEYRDPVQCWFFSLVGP
jgi:hypothetical protein